jgi:hypothetical protein
MTWGCVMRFINKILVVQHLGMNRGAVTQCLLSMGVILCLLLAACEDETATPPYEGPEPPKSTAIRPQQSEEGDCANFDFSPYMRQDGKLDLSIQLRVLRDMAKVYPSAQAQQPNKTLLAFSTPLRHGGELSDGRIKVAKLGQDEPLGWVSLNDLLCTNRPIIDPDKRLEKRFFIKTEIQQRKQGKSSAFVNAYPMPKEQCYGKCRKLSPFTMYFVVDQEKDWYLLADDYHITHPLVGWVRKTDGFLWNTAYGLRPRDDLEYVDKQGNVIDGAVCVYRSLYDALNNHHCIPVLGGKRWYQSSVRIPMLDIVDRNGSHIPPKDFAEYDKKGGRNAFYKVAISSMVWEFIAQENCETLGKQCNESVYDTTFEGYIPVSDDISLDVWMTGNQLLDFKQNVLRIFKDIPIQRSSAKRAQIVRTIAETLKIRLMEPEIDPEETFADYIQRKGGLPVSRNSLLLSYTPEQLEDESIVPDCELERLVALATNKETMLSIIYEGNYRPVFKAEQYPESGCTKASQNGKRIPFISSRITKKPLGDDDTYRYDHEFRGKIIYWVPQEYLP